MLRKELNQNKPRVFPKIKVHTLLVLGLIIVFSFLQLEECSKHSFLNTQAFLERYLKNKTKSKTKQNKKCLSNGLLHLALYHDADTKP